MLRRAGHEQQELSPCGRREGPAAQPLEKTRLADMSKLETCEYHVTRRAYPGHLPQGHEILLPEGRRQGGPTSSVYNDPKLGTSPGNLQWASRTTNPMTDSCYTERG